MAFDLPVGYALVRRSGQFRQRILSALVRTRIRDERSTDTSPLDVRTPATAPGQLAGRMPVGELSVLASSFSWAASNIVAKTARTARALHVSVVHSWIALAVLLVISLSFGLVDDMLRTPWRAALLLGVGAALGTLGNIAFFTAVARGEVGRTFTTTTSLNVLFSILAGWLALNEPIGGATWIGAAAILGGVYIVNRRRELAASPIASPAARGRGFTPGVVALAVFAAGMWSIGLIATKVGLRDTDVITGAVLRNLVPAIAYFAIAWLSPTIRLAGVPPADLKRLAFSAGFFVLSLLGWTFALQRSDASVIAILSATSPVFAYLLAVAFLKEKVRIQVIGGIVLSLSGVLLIVST